MLVLHRIDPGVNVRRFYALSLEDSLFGDTLLVRRWGRIGTYGRVRFDWFDTNEAAAKALSCIAAKKERRGYQAYAPKVFGF